MRIKCAITGGHLTPALPVISEMKKESWEIVWLGEEYAHEGEKVSTLEAKVIPTLGIPFYTISAGKFHRRNIAKTFLSLWKFPKGLVQSLKILKKEKPNVILSFGSYVGIPTALAGRILGIPVVTHEQTAVSGLANRIISTIATKVAITFPNSKKYFPGGKVVETGNPIRREFFQIAKNRKTKKTGIPVLLITGGSRGSRTINNSVKEILGDLLSICRVFHQTGHLDYEDLKNASETLPEEKKKKYEVVANYTPDEFEKVLSVADVVVARAGANTVLEIAAVGVPAIFIPIPWSGSDEQTKNAEALVQAGTAKILPQEKLKPETLFKEIKDMLGSSERYRKNAKSAQKLAKPEAGLNLFKLVQSVVKQK